MKNVKIYDSKMLPIGIVDIENLPQNLSGKFVKVYDPATMLPAGVIELGAELSDTQKTLLINTYDENLAINGTSVAESLAPTPTPEDSFEISIGNPTSRQMQANDTITFTNGFVAGDFVGHLGFTINGKQFKLYHAAEYNAYVFTDAYKDYTRGMFEAVQSEEPITSLKFTRDIELPIPSDTTFEFYS